MSIYTINQNITRWWVLRRPLRMHVLRTSCVEVRYNLYPSFISTNTNTKDVYRVEIIYSRLHSQNCLPNWQDHRNVWNLAHSSNDNCYQRQGLIFTYNTCGKFWHGRPDKHTNWFLSKMSHTAPKQAAYGQKSWDLKEDYGYFSCNASKEQNYIWSTILGLRRK